MKICACLTVLNEEDWLFLTLKSIYPYMDKIVIAEGAEPSAMFSATPEGLSIDKTADIIRTFPDPQDKIVFIQKGSVATLHDLRNAALSKMPPDTDWVLSMGGDTLYKPEDLEYCLEIIPKAPQVSIYDFNSFMFHRDIYHLKYDLIPMCVPRFWKYYPGLSCSKKTWNDGNLFVNDKPLGEMGQHLHLTISNLYHMGYAKGRKRLLSKLLWNVKFFGRAGQFGYGDICKKSDEEIKKWIAEKEPFFRDDCPGQNIIKFRGKYPLHEEVIARWKEIKDK